MTAARNRVRQLARLLALAEAESRRAAHALGSAGRTHQDAIARQQGIDRILAETRPDAGPSRIGQLLAGAQLRHLLDPAASAATAARVSGLAACTLAEARLRGATAKADKLADRLHEVRSRNAGEAERRAVDALPARRSSR